MIYTITIVCQIQYYLYSINNQNVEIKMDLANRIKTRRTQLNLTQTELAKLAGTTQQNIAKMEKTPGEQTTSLIVPLSIALKCDAQWLEYGTGDTSNYLIKKPNSFYIEVLDVTASAGVGYLNSDVEQVIKLVEYDSEQAKILFRGVDADNLKIINISGDSMQGTFDSGDSIYVDVSKKEFNGDGIYVFTFGKSLYVKRLQIIKNKLIVISDNKKYKEWDITEEEIDQLYIHGKVMLSQSMQLKKHG